MCMNHVSELIHLSLRRLISELVPRAKALRREADGWGTWSVKDPYSFKKTIYLFLTLLHADLWLSANVIMYHIFFIHV